MAGFRRVDARQAGPRALGILVPPGEPTVVILRPRSLAWDLLPLQAGCEHMQPAVFARQGRDQSAAAARRVFRELEAAVGRTCPLEIVASNNERLGICLRADGLLWIACARAGGQTYQPWFSGERAEVDALFTALTAIFWPSADATQEVYFNTQAFSA